MDATSNKKLTDITASSKSQIKNCPSADAERRKEVERRIAEHEAYVLNSAIRDLEKAAGLPTRHATTFKGNSHPLWNDKFLWMKNRLGQGGIHAFCGPRGTGKTQMAVELIRAFIREKQRESLYQTVMDFFMALKQTYNSKGESSEQIVISRLARPSLLILDEFHERSETEWENMMFTHLIDRRYRTMRDTIIISNQTPEMFSQSVGHSVIDRIVETGRITLFNELPSFRML